MAADKLAAAPRFFMGAAMEMLLNPLGFYLAGSGAHIKAFEIINFQ